MCFQAKQFDSALALFDRYIQKGYKDSYSLFYRANALKSLGKLDDAEIAYKESIRLDPEFIDPQMGLTDILLAK